MTIDDDLAGAALTAFARRALPGRSAEVSVDVASGIARIRGRVHTERDAEAIVDLLRCHEGVRGVVSELAVSAAGVASSMET